MSFLTAEPQNFLNIKLTDTGRRQLSLGQLTFTKAIFSDREIDYNVGRTSAFSLANSKVMSPKDANPTFTQNFDGSGQILLQGNQVTSSRQIATATTATAGFFTGATNSFAIDVTKTLGTAVLAYSANTLDGANLNLTFNAGGYTAATGDLIFIQFQPVQNSGITYSSSSVLLSGNPVNSLWYRVSATTSPLHVTVDRAVPSFGGLNTSSTQKINAYFYPANGIENFYGSGSSVACSVWNMNIVRTGSVEGAMASNSGYTCYGSVDYAGAKQYFGFDDASIRQIGIIHYSNNFSGSQYSENLVEGSVVLNLPTVMWHNSPQNSGQGIPYGLTLSDSFGTTLYDNTANTTFRYLLDSNSSAGNIVGRVYHKLKIILITDSELLAALSYKSNRSYTLPPLIPSLVASPKYPLTTSSATGVIGSGQTIFFTYIPETNGGYLSGSSFGYNQALHCSYIGSIDGQSGPNGQNQYLSLTFPNLGFPYLRKSSDTLSSSPYSGSGWVANSVQLLVNIQPSNLYGAGNLPENGWMRVSSKSAGGNGIFSSTTFGDLTVDSNKLLGYNFIISNEDILSGSQYTLTSTFTGGSDTLFWGNESFFFGNLDTSIISNTFKTSIVAYAANDTLNSSLNSTFDNTVDTVFFTEVAVLDANDNFVAVGKTTSPIKKNSGRFIALQLEIDF